MDTIMHTMQRRKLSFLAEAAVLLGLGLLVVLVIGQWRGALRQPAQAAQAAEMDSTAACAADLQRLQRAVIQYTRDNDETFPPMQSAAAFQAALLPYVGDPSVFRCPETGLPYTPNAALSGKSYPALTSEVDTVAVVQDSAPHADGLTTVVFEDAHVEHGGVEVGDPVVILTSRAKALALAVAQYAQDYDETLPPMQTVTAFQAAVLPYARSPRIFSAPNGQPFVPNAALSGVFVTTIAHPDTTVLFQDAPPSPDGLATVAFVDGHLERGGVEYGDPNAIVVSRAKQLALAVTQYAQDYDETLPPMQTVAAFQAALAPYLRSSRAFSNTDGQAFAPNPALSGVGYADIPVPNTTVLFQDTAPYTGGTPTTAAADGHVTHVVLPHAHLLWTSTSGTAAIWTQDGAGDLASTPALGPLAGWTARSIADGSDGLTRLLWTSATGAAHVWTVNDADGYYTATPDFGPYDAGRWTAVSLAVGPDARTWLQWKHSLDGQSSVWTLDSADHVTSTPGFGPYGPWTASALTVGSDGFSRLLWGDGAGQFSVWTIDSSGSITSTPAFSPAGFTPTAMSGGPDTDTRLLISRTDGAMAVWTVDVPGNVTSTPLYGPISGFTCHGLSVGPDALSRVLWSRTDGASAVWTIAADGSIASTPLYGPISGWSATAISVGP